MIRTVKDYEKLSEQYNKMLEERNSLIDDLSWYKAKVSRFERENEKFKESHIKHITNMENYYKDRVQEHKEKNGELQEVIEGKNSDLLFTEDENKQLKESRDWDYEYIIKVNEENKRLKREKEEFHRKLMTQLEVNTTLRMSNRYKLNLLSEFSQHIGNKPSSSTYKYFRAKLDGLGIKEGATMKANKYEYIWKSFKKGKTIDYITWPNAEKREDLLRMDKLDNTNEFSNLLSDLEDKQYGL